MGESWKPQVVVVVITVVFLLSILLCVYCRACTSSAARRAEASRRQQDHRRRRHRPQPSRGRRVHPAESFYLDDRMLVSVISSGQSGQSTPPQFDTSLWDLPPPYSPPEEDSSQQAASQEERSTTAEGRTVPRLPATSVGGPSPPGASPPDALALRRMGEPPPVYEPSPDYL